MKVTVEVSNYEVERITGEINAFSSKKISKKEAAERVAQDLMNRYFNTEYLDAERLSDN